MTEADGTGIGHSQLTVTLGRGDLGAKLECRALSPTLDVPMAAWVEVDVYVRPLTWELTGYNAPVLAGSVVNLLCQVKGARPAANITWFNGTNELSPQPSSNLAVQVKYRVPVLE
ncbi:Cell adhesion molecule 2, partial [Orchesella cincta]